MPLNLKAKLAKLYGSSRQDAVKLALQAELDHVEEALLRDRLAALRAAHPLPAATGVAADKAFFDELSGDYDDLRRRFGPHCDYCR